jgi:hypothetical protein
VLLRVLISILINLMVDSLPANNFIFYESYTFQPHLTASNTVATPHSSPRS